VVDIPASGIKKEITKILLEKGYILNYKFEDEIGFQGNIKIALKFNPETKVSAIKALERISKPGLRQYCDQPKYTARIKRFGHSNYLYLERCYYR
jgi:small subunit ribosomal protein S8